ncbi:hypothetical protein Tco_0871581 [Tanacetum coccineum]
MPPRRINQAAIERLVADRVAAAIVEHEENRVNAVGVGAAGPAGAGVAEPFGGVAGGNAALKARGCTYKRFLNCNPYTFSGTEGAVGLSKWFEKLDSFSN